MAEKKKKKVKGRVKKRSSELLFKILTVVFGTASLLLTIYSIRLQRKENESRQIIQEVGNLLSNLSDTTSSKEAKDVIGFIQKEIPRDYKSYVKSVGKIADSLKLYEKKLRNYEKKIVESLLPNKPLLRSVFNRKGYTKEEGWIFEILEPKDEIKAKKDETLKFLIKLNIHHELVYCFHIMLLKKDTLVGSYDFYPQGTYNKIVIESSNISGKLTAQVGIFLKEDKGKMYPKFYCKKRRIIFINNKNSSANKDNKSGNGA